MSQYIVRRFLQMIPIAFGILTLVFSLIHLIPGDPARQIAGENARPEDIIAVRVGDWKLHLAVQRANTMRQWAEPFVKLRLPYIMSMRRDPFERAEYNSNTYMDWMVDHVPQLYMMQAVIAGQIAAFAKFPPRQKPASFNLDAVLAQVAHHG